MNPPNRRIDFDLYLITDRFQTGGRSLDAVVREALAGGVRAVQLRENDLPTREILRQAEALRLLTAEFGAKLFINHHVDVCLAVEADGVHLRADSLPVPAVRRLLGPDRLIGQSTHGVREAVGAQRAGADFVVLGPVYDTPSKRGMGAPLGLSVLQAAASEVSIPIFAVGGVRTERIPELLRSGAGGIAVVSALLDAQDVRAAASAMRREWESRRVFLTRPPV